MPLPSLGLVLSSFYYVEMGSPHTQFGKSFHDEWMLNFMKCFPCVYGDDHLVFVLSFVDVLDHTD